MDARRDLAQRALAIVWQDVDDYCPTSLQTMAEAVPRNQRALGFQLVWDNMVPLKVLAGWRSHMQTPSMVEGGGSGSAADDKGGL